MSVTVAVHWPRSAFAAYTYAVWGSVGEEAL